MPTKIRTYKSLQAELDSVLEQLQTQDVDIDTALILYRQGQKLVKELEVYLETAKNEVKATKLV